MNMHANYYAKLTRRRLQRWHIWLCHMGADHYQCLDSHISVPDKCTALICSCEPKDKPSAAWDASPLWRLHKAEIFTHTAPSFKKDNNRFLIWAPGWRQTGLKLILWQRIARKSMLSKVRGQHVSQLHISEGTNTWCIATCAFLFSRWELHNDTERLTLPPPQQLLLLPWFHSPPPSSALCLCRLLTLVWCY